MTKPPNAAVPKWNLEARRRNQKKNEGKERREEVKKSRNVLWKDACTLPESGAKRIAKGVSQLLLVILCSRKVPFGHSAGNDHHSSALQELVCPQKAKKLIQQQPVSVTGDLEIVASEIIIAIRGANASVLGDSTHNVLPRGVRGKTGNLEKNKTKSTNKQPEFSTKSRANSTYNA